MPPHTDFETIRGMVTAALEAGDDATAITVMRTIERGMLQEHGATVRELASRIPQELWPDSPTIAAGMGASYRSAGSPRGPAALSYFEAAEGGLDAAGAPVTARIEVALDHAAALRGQGRLDEAAGRLAVAEALLADAPIASRVGLRARADLEHGMVALHLGRVDDAVTRLHSAYGLSRTHLTRAERMECQGALALIDHTRCDLVNAEQRSADALALGAGTSLLTSVFAAPATAAAMMTALDREDADRVAQLEHALVAAARRTEWEPFVLVLQAWARSSAGATAEALELLDRGRQSFAHWRPHGVWRDVGELLRADLLITVGDAEGAWPILGAVGPYDRHVVCPGRVAARLRLAHGDVLGADEALAGCAALGEQHAARTAVDVRLIRAAIEAERGNLGAADVNADLAMVAMARNGLRAPLRQLTPGMLSRLAARAASRAHGTESGPLIEAMRAAGDDGVSAAEPLTQRERLVLGHVARGLTVSAMAGELFVSPNTMKTHLRRIYRKLGVASRAEAIRRARMLGITAEGDGGTPGITPESPGAEPVAGEEPVI